MRFPLTLVLGALILSVACTQGSEDPSGPEEPRVAASFYPLYEAAQRVGGNRVEVGNLTPPGVEPHDLELTTAQTDVIIDSDLVVYLGGGFQPSIEETLTRASGKTIDVLEGLELIEGGPDADDGHEVDPHVWLDPHQMSGIVTRIEEALISLDPQGRDGYTLRAEAYRTEMKGLDEAFRTWLADCKRDLIVTNHASFGYLAARYGLQQETISGLTPESEPDPRRIAELTDLVRRRGVTTIFTETLASPRVAETLAREAGVRTGVLNPLEGLSDEQLARGQTYVTVMNENLFELRAALDCNRP